MVPPKQDIVHAKAYCTAPLASDTLPLPYQSKAVCKLISPSRAGVDWCEQFDCDVSVSLLLPSSLFAIWGQGDRRCCNATKDGHDDDR